MGLDLTMEICPIDIQEQARRLAAQLEIKSEYELGGYFPQALAKARHEATNYDEILSDLRALCGEYTGQPDYDPDAAPCATLTEDGETCPYWEPAYRIIKDAVEALLTKPPATPTRGIGP